MKNWSSRPWTQELHSLLDRRATMAPAQLVEAVAKISATVEEQEADDFLEETQWWRPLSQDVTRLYYQHIVEMETTEVDMLLQGPARPGAQYVELASPRGRVSYERVADMFANVDFRHCRRFIMVGAGQLPVTALHAMATTDVPEILTVDISERAVRIVERLVEHFGWSRLVPTLEPGHLLDYAGADVVYLANMISPKGAALQRALQTAPKAASIIIREPYGLGRLWAEKAELSLPPGVRVAGRGPVSGHLSRDLYLERS